MVATARRMIGVFDGRRTAEAEVYQGVNHFAVVGFDPAGRLGVAALKIARLDDNGRLSWS